MGAENRTPAILVAMSNFVGHCDDNKVIPERRLGQESFTSTQMVSPFVTHVLKYEELDIYSHFVDDWSFSLY